jgi:transposase-like protein
VIRELGLGRERRIEVQRFACLKCGHTFSLRVQARRRYSEAFALEVVQQHLDGKSYRVIAREVYGSSGRKISPTSLVHMVQESTTRCKSAWEISRERRPRWEGYLLLDEKMVSVAGQHLWFYGAFDSSGDVVHWRAVRELRVDEAMSFLQEVQALHYPCRGITTDMDTVLRRAVQEEYGEKPHQYCLKHALGALETDIGYKPLMVRRKRIRRALREEFEGLRERKGVYLRRAHHGFLDHWHETRDESRNARAIRDLRDACYVILFARTEAKARERLDELRSRRSILVARKWKAIAFLERHWEHLMMHHHVRHLPRTNNIAEGFNKQIQRRLKTIESFQHRATAIPYMNLLVAYLRFKPYTDCRGNRKHLNGKNRLQAAGLKRTPTDWLGTCLKHAEIGNR